MVENKKKHSKTKKIVKQLKRNKKSLIILIAIFAVIIWGMYKLIVFVQNPTDTFSVEQGKIYQEERATGYIIREETIVKGSNYKNGIEQIKTEGERVAKQEPIFRYYTSGENNLVNKIKELDTKIEEVTEKENILSSGDIKTLEKEIEGEIVSLYGENNIQNIARTKKEISKNIVKKAKIAGELSPAGSYLRKLIDERSEYENKLNEGAEYLSAPISGVISYKVDGYENVLTTQDFSKLNSKSLEGLNLKVGQVVTDSQESAKIINNFECYIASILDSQQAKQAQVGQTVKLRLINEIEISSKIVHIINEDNKVIIVFEIDKQVQEMISFRKISFDIIWWSYSGKKVPNEAIAYEQKGNNQVAYVVTTRVGYQDKIWVKVLRNNEKYTIVENYESEELKELGYNDKEIRQRSSLTLYDEILKKPTQ